MDLATPRQRVPFYVAAPLVLACGLAGYGLSLALPMQSTAVVAAVQPETEDAGESVAVLPSPATPTLAMTSATATAPPRSAPPQLPQALGAPVQSDRVADRMAGLIPPPPLVETGSVQIPIAVSDPLRSEASRSRARIHEVRRKRIRRAYIRRRPAVAQSPGSMEALWAWMTK